MLAAAVRSGIRRTFLARKVSVTISPTKPLSVSVKVPMFAMIVLLDLLVRAATIAVSMAIDRPGTIDAASACGPKRDAEDVGVLGQEC